MSKNPRRLGRPVRLIVSVEAEVVEAIDRLMTQGRHHGHRNRAEFVRQAIEQELARCRSDAFRTPVKGRLVEKQPIEIPEFKKNKKFLTLTLLTFLN
ncbi:ribbon-helix-helix domain-containing protein [Halomonas aquatica]|uniref:Ribbon-helix-helix domain-containing protein n=1 Tax=Halomonas aquatica TaxID=3151123 RepID=A0ABV1NCT9_9GAMM